MKAYTLNNFVMDDYTIPNLHSDFRIREITRQDWRGADYIEVVVEVIGTRIESEATLAGVTIDPTEWYKLIGISKTNNRVTDAQTNIGQWSGLTNYQYWDAQFCMLDSLYYLSNPPTLRLLNGKLRKGIYKEVARRVKSRLYKYSTQTTRLLNVVIDEVKAQNPDLNNTGIVNLFKVNFGIEKIGVCYFTDKIYPEPHLRNLNIRREYRQCLLNLNPEQFGFVEARAGHFRTWIHNTEVMIGNHIYLREALTWQRCPICGNDEPEQSFSDGICLTCQESRYKIHSYSTKVPTLLKFKAKNVKPTTLYLGIELEYEATDRDRARVKVGKQLEGHAIMKSDGSIRNGFEIVTCPATLEIHREEFKKFYDNLPGELFAASNTGMHVHVSRKPLNLFTIGKMTEFVNRHDNKDFIAHIAGRIDNSYARQDQYRTVSYPLVNTGRSTERYNALNLSPPDTIEFRIFSTPMNWEQFASRLEFCQALTDYCQPAQVGTSLKHLTHHSSFINWMKSHRKDYPELANHLKGFA